MTADFQGARASAPVRLDLAGGWTDVPPIADAEGGVVINAAIALRAHAHVTFGVANHEIRCADTGDHSVQRGEEWLPAHPAFDFHRAALARAPLPPALISTRSDVPRGSGLGGSGALGVALVAALNASRGIEQNPREIAEAAFEFESVGASIPGGRQDQYAAALGGFHRLHFGGPRVRVEALSIESAFAEALRHSIVIAYTGVSRLSGRTIARVIASYEQGDQGVVGAMRGMVEVAHQMAEALQRGDLAAVGMLMQINWEHQQALDPGMRTAEMARLERSMDDAGLLGAKGAGSGAGGSMIFVVRDPAQAIRIAEAHGATVLPCRWSPTGVEVSTP